MITVERTHVLARLAWLSEHAPETLSAEGLREHEAEVSRLRDQIDRHASACAELQRAAMARAFPSISAKDNP